MDGWMDDKRQRPGKGRTIVEHNTYSISFCAGAGERPPGTPSVPEKPSGTALWLPAAAELLLPEPLADWMVSIVSVSATICASARASAARSLRSSITMSVFMVGRVHNCRARSPNLSVFTLSVECTFISLMASTSTVLALPPSESCSSRVSLESRYLL